MTTILCFGDSNTWGYSPCGTRRYGPDERWTKLLIELLPDDCHIVEEGQPGRTTVYDDPFEDAKNARTVLRPILESHHPDIVVVMLGTNDLKSRFGLSAFDVSMGAARLVQDIQGFNHRIKPTAPQVLLVAPPPILETGRFGPLLVGGAQKSLEFAQQYRARAAELGCEFLDAGEWVESSRDDGIHWPLSEHRKFATALAPKLREML